ncbi:MAG TPA: ATP-dependent Clp protease ATP-binding subunit [Candidatus Saccharimonadales bacterium]|nr:ATP-dependent Clp protease ATP-binding subunit [Candidatus Saccharimonadales bacterium]
MNQEVDLKSLRARKARLGHRISPQGANVLGIIAVLLIGGAVYCFAFGDIARIGYICAAVASALSMFLLWYQYDLKTVAPHLPTSRLDDIMEPGLLASLKAPITPRSAWEAACKNPEARFITNHLLLDTSSLTPTLSTNEQDMPPIWQQVHALVDTSKRPEVHAGTLATAIMLNSPVAQQFLTQSKLRPEELGDVLLWTERQLAYFRQPQPYFGGIGRDWATGFTPTLEHFAQNLSLGVQMSGGAEHYQAHGDLLDGIANSLARDNGVALVGMDGTGKSTLVRGLAERLLTGSVPSLQYYQIVSLNASLILSYSGSQLEKLMLTLFGEAAASGNIILFLDDAELFFSSGAGAFDMSQILLPVLKNHHVKIIAAFTPTDWQQLQAARPALASSFASVTINEPAEADIYKIVEDNALLMENRYKVIISYEGVREAIRLSGQYMQEQAYPGKAIALLEQSMPYVQNGAITAETVQVAVEKTKGVKVSSAQAPEAEMLLRLEDRIHERMINQKRAVNVVASALRRGRAGVSNPKRPVGSFLFLGPTGVGKTELARSLAAVYFGNEQQMIRLDMSEYQRPEDVSRLLAAGGQNDHSLLLAIRQQPFSVVLLDEVEKAHPNILNLLLQMLDEGQLTDEQGRPASFKSAIIIATSNAGAADIAGRVKDGGTLDDFERPLIDKLISQGQFKPELVNRFDEVVLFRPLNEEELAQVATVMLQGVNKTLAAQQITVELTSEALKQIVHQGYDPEFGARPMRRIIQKTVENAVAVKILRQEAGPGSVITLDVQDLAPSGD